MHMKLWVFDSNSVYIGSANMDWLSLAQVKEVGVVIENSSSTVAADASALFESWWSWSSPELRGGRWVTTAFAPYLVMPDPQPYQQRYL